MAQMRKSQIRVIVTYLVFYSLIVSLMYAVAGIILTAINRTPFFMFFRQERGYGLMLLQCALGLAILFLPGILERRCKIVIENYIYIFFVIFLFAAIILGEVHDFYYRVPHWDTLLHACSGVMLGAVGVSVIDILNKSKNVKLNLSEGFVAIFAFFFAVSLGAIWEIYEYLIDLFLGFNMQRYRAEDGTQFLGQLALYDTMKDLIVDVIGSLVICVIGYAMLKNKNKHILKLIPPAERIFEHSSGESPLKSNLSSKTARKIPH
ncbi:MAG: hypothetical protein LBC27_01135 [Spirochaetaceae bacterium]|jgi:uncharacterized membrane protein YjdF|nr:hypothetical protein [Spirochaetaceae bacterium]